MAGIEEILQNLTVKNVIISKQYQETENYKEFIKITNKKKIKVHTVQAGDTIKIEKNLKIDILWPDSKNIIEENSINNNSLVCKITYKKFSILFTGDIEKVAEEKILLKYAGRREKLKANFLKVAHHGSKTSSTEKFINVVKPKNSLIGVGKNNKFGHPSDDTIQNLEKINCKILRTDTMGEIKVEISGEKIKVTQMYIFSKYYK